MNFEQKTKNFIERNRLFASGAGVLIGLSGGADSVALLEVLCSMREAWDLRLAAVHVHHGIRQDADLDVEFCENLCAEKQIPFWVEYVQVPKLAEEQKLSVEEAGRQARYTVFEKYRKELKLDVIAVAHHKNDQAETILFQLFRGSGLRGLSGISARRGAIVRPLLAVTREEIEAYLAKKGMSYVTDSTNNEDIYARNKVRHHILPAAEEISKGAAEHIYQAGQQLREVLDFMEQEAKCFLDKYSSTEAAATKQQAENVKLPLREFQMLHPALQKMVLLEAVERTGCGRKDFNEQHIESILALLDKEGEKELHLPRGLIARKSYETLILGWRRRVNFSKDCKGHPQSAEGLQESMQEAAIKDAAIQGAAIQDAAIQGAYKALVVEPNKQYVLPSGLIMGTKLIFRENQENILENIPKSDCIKWFDYDKIKGVLCLRHRQKGDYLTIREDGSRKSLQDYFINEKIPKSEREQVWVLADGQHIVWVPGKRISACYKVTEQTNRILEIYIGGNENG